MFQQGFLPLADQIEHKRLAFAKPVANVAAELDGNTNHWWFEAGLHDPTREHAGGPCAGAHGENKNAAWNLPDCRIERMFLAHPKYPSVNSVGALVQAAAELLLHTRNFTLQPAFLTAAEIELGGARYAIAVRGGLLDATAH